MPSTGRTYTELADQLDGLAGTGAGPLLRALPVDLEMVTEILEGDPLTGGGALDLRTGEVWPRAAVEYANGRGAFRRFADTLRRESEDELSRWFAFTGERKRGRARAWLADLGYRVASC